MFSGEGINGYAILQQYDAMLIDKYRCFGGASISVLRIYKIQQKIPGRQWK
jgi:hypothetical protein